MPNDYTLSRNGNLIGKAFRQTIVATTLSNIAPLVASFTDALFVGNLLGAKALTALSATLPVVSLIYICIAIFMNGANMLACRENGAGNSMKARQIFTVSVYSSAVSAVLCFVLCRIYRDRICGNIAAGDPEVTGLAMDYFSVLSWNILLYPLANLSGLFVSGEGNPKRTTKSVAAGALLNILLDALLIGPLGIAGAAIGTVCSTVLTASLIIVYMVRGGSNYKLEQVKTTWKLLLKENFKHGFTFCIIVLMMNLFLFAASPIISRTLGENVYIWSICIQIQYVCFAIAIGATGGSVLLSSRLLGEGDNFGARFVVNRLLVYILVFFGTLSILLWLLPDATLFVFGIRNAQNLTLCRICLGFFSIYLLSFAFMCAYTNVFHVMGHLKAKLIFVTVFIVSVFIAVLISSHWRPTLMMFSMASTSIAVNFVCLAFAYHVHCRDNSLTRFTLAPLVPKMHQLEISLDAFDEASVREALDRISKFSVKSSIPQDKMDILEQCVLLLFSKTPSDSARNQVDARIIDTSGRLKCYFKAESFPSVNQELQKLSDDFVRYHIFGMDVVSFSVIVGAAL